jgi:anti-anti-sigma factor
MSVSGTEIGAESFRVDTRAFDGGLVLVLAGEFDLTGLSRFREAWSAIVQAAPERVVVDFTELQFIDSSGISAIVDAISHEEQDGRRLQACGIRDQVQRVLDLVGVLARLELVGRPQPTSTWPAD